ncbi:MAG TPA: STAS domain-containing protein [Deltaproteobacteria bacterium]|jgi:ABC-type transporter Mla MlaB component|nr:STAS domain-containing protein [Deltaproteobacteria bacterium]HOI05981.1 STAS domain-containing protein [Deltaproteobacteria bacterium]
MGTIEVKDTETGRTMTLSGALGIDQAAELRNSLLEALKGRPALKLDLSMVQSADLACMQVLCAAHRSSARTGIRMTLVSGVPQGLKQSMLDMAIDPTACDPPLSRECLWKKEDCHV